MKEKCERCGRASRSGDKASVPEIRIQEVELVGQHTQRI